MGKDDGKGPGKAPGGQAKGGKGLDRKRGAAVLLLLAVGLLLLIGFARGFAQGVDDLIHREEAEFKERRGELKQAIEDVDALVAAESPAQPFIDSARFAHAFAGVEADHSLKVAQQRLSEGFAYLCEAKDAVGEPCGPPDHDWKKAVSDHPAFPVTLTMLGIGSTMLSAYVANFHSVLMDALARSRGGGRK